MINTILTIFGIALMVSVIGAAYGTYTAKEKIYKIYNTSWGVIAGCSLVTLILFNVYG